ncbi:MAG: lytic polysaccharide monooxygenase [Akkermansiaceae bacterium]|jgi:predicted carbohydrate-binding protein with CBM5 and CBM33 domain|nr:lytic polysaccharide monooxygenase [Akkermansiaceae bacterium]
MKLSFIVYFPIYTFLITNVFSHGSVGDPVSRSYRIFQENPESPKDVASLAAIETAGTQAFYDWHEVSRLVPKYDPESIEAYRAIIPDNQLAGAGRQKYSGLDLVRDDWPATSVNPGPYPVIFDAWTPHDPSYFLAFITREDWTPDQTLKWDDLESLSGTDLVVRDGNYYRFTVNFPPRIGKHILYVIWQRNDPAGEVFFPQVTLILVMVKASVILAMVSVI